MSVLVPIVLAALVVSLIYFSVVSEKNKFKDPGFRVGDVIEMKPTRETEPWETDELQWRKTILAVSPTAYKIDSKLFPTLLKRDAWMYRKVQQ